MKQKKRKLKTIPPNLLTKIGIILSPPSYLESQSAWTWKTKEEKKLERVFPLISWHPQTIANKQTQFLYQGIAHGSINIHHLVSRTILPIKTRKKTTKSNLFCFFVFFKSSTTSSSLSLYLLLCLPWIFFNVILNTRVGCRDWYFSSNQRYLRCILWLCDVRHASKNN